MATARVVVVGTGYAGMLAATRLARRAGPRAHVTLVGASEHFVERVRLHEHAARGRPVTHAVAPIIAGAGGTFRHARAEGIDLRTRAVTLSDGALPFDALVIATGSATAHRLPGSREHALTLDAAYADTVRERVHAALARGGALVVVGAGLTGIEAASEFAGAYPGADVTLVCDGPVGPALAPATRDRVREILTLGGVRVEEGVRVEAFEQGVVRARGRSFRADVALWAGGFEASGFARAAGLPVDDLGRVEVDATLALPGHEGVYIVGDAARPPAACGPVLMSCKFAMPMAAHTADNIDRALRGRARRPFAVADSLVCISLGRRDAALEWRRADGRASGRVTTGWRATLVKEIICKMVATTPRFEQHGLHVYAWPKPATAPALPAHAAGAQ